MLLIASNDSKVIPLKATPNTKRVRASQVCINLRFAQTHQNLPDKTEIDSGINVSPNVYSSKYDRGYPKDGKEPGSDDGFLEKSRAILKCYSYPDRRLTGRMPDFSPPWDKQPDSEQ
ncbi:unnamed protein product, partial [Iphiclides podalirius]